MSVRKSLLLATLSVAFYTPLIAQRTLPGTVLSAEGKPLSNATLTLLSHPASQTLGFGFSRADGQFSLPLPVAITDSFRLTVAHIGFSPASILLSAKALPAPLKFSLSPSTKPLPEVTVRNKNIYQRGDTVNYNVAGFQQRQDLVIGDVIARLPGMEVKPNGQILYQGRPINKYYIEGGDLLEDRYNLANNNLPADAVQQVQVLENHQPIKALDSLRPSLQAAINLKLKAGYKGRLTGRGKLGAGAPPFGADLEAVPMHFAAGSQTLATAKHNSLGKDYTMELTRHDAGSWENSLRGGLQAYPNTNVPMPNPPAIAAQRYLFNRLTQLSMNHLRKGRKGVEWKGYLDAYTDRQSQTAGSRNRFFFPQDTIEIVENSALVLKPFLLRAAIIAQRNEASHYMKNVVTAQLQGRLEDALTTGSLPLQQQMRFTDFALANEWQQVRNRQGKTRLLNSFVSMARHTEHLRLSPGPKPFFLLPDTGYALLQQPLTRQLIFTRNSMGLGSARRGHWRVEGSLGFSALHSQFTNRLQLGEGQAKTALVNDFRHTELGLEAQASALWQKGGWRFSTGLSPMLLQAWARSADTAFRNLRLLPNPNLLLQYQPNGRWTFQLSAMQMQRFLGSEHALPGWVLNNYRSFGTGTGFLRLMTIQNASATVMYKNVLKSQFINTGLRWDNTGFNYLADQRFQGVVQTRQYLNIWNPAPSLSTYLRWSQQWGAWGANGSASLGRSRSRQLQNGLLNTGEVEQLSLGAGGQGQVGWWGGQYQLGYQRMTQRLLGRAGRGTLHNFNQSLSMQVSAGKDWLLMGKTEHYAFGSSPLASSHYWFTDLLLRKTWAGKRKWQAELSWQNVGNQGRFGNALLMPNQQAESFFLLRPAQWSLSVQRML